MDRCIIVGSKSFEEICKEAGGKLRSSKLCLVNGYPMYYNKRMFRYEPDSEVLCLMDPDKFLDRTTSLPFWFKPGLEDIEHKIKEGLPLDPPYLKVDVDRKVVISHEGRHRAKVAKELGVSEIPVLVYYGKDDRFVDVENTGIIDIDSIKPEDICWKRY